MGSRVTPLDPNTPKGAQVAQELGELLARIAVDIHQREQASSATKPATAAPSQRARTSTPSSERRAA